MLLPSTTKWGEFQIIHYETLKNLKVKFEIKKPSGDIPKGYN